MLTRSRIRRDLFPRVARRALAVAALLAALASAAPLAPEAHAQKRNGKRPTTGVIEISTTPGGNPIYIDDVYSGETTEYMRVFPNQTPGPHTVKIIFPNGTAWTHVVNTIAGRKECISLNYRPRTIDTTPIIQSPCPYPVNVSAPATAADGDMITFSADVAYTGQSALNYTWTVSPPTAIIRNGAGTPTITVDTTGSGRRVTAILVVDDGSGDRACRQTAQASTAITTTRITEEETRDDFVSVAPDDDKARLDMLAVKMQEKPTYRAYVIAYGGCGRGQHSPEVLLERAHSYLVRERGMDASRITRINGGYRERNGFELWVQSPGKSDPVARPTRGPCNARR